MHATKTKKSWETRDYDEKWDEETIATKKKGGLFTRKAVIASKS
jgi:hypothetical protein